MRLPGKENVNNYNDNNGGAFSFSPPIFSLFDNTNNNFNIHNIMKTENVNENQNILMNQNIFQLSSNHVQNVQYENNTTNLTLINNNINRELNSKPDTIEINFDDEQDTIFRKSLMPLSMQTTLSPSSTGNTLPSLISNISNNNNAIQNSVSTFSNTFNNTILLSSPKTPTNLNSKFEMNKKKKTWGIVPHNKSYKYNQNDEGYWTCDAPNCKSTFLTIEHLKIHNQKYHKKGFYGCAYCSRMYRSHKNAQNHLVSQHSGKPDEYINAVIYNSCTRVATIGTSSKVCKRLKNLKKSKKTKLILKKMKDLIFM